MIKELILRFQETDAERTAFSLYDGERVTDMTYRQFAEDVLKAAGYYAANQIRGRHIALIAPNSYEWVVALFAVIASGNVAVPLNAMLPPEMLKQQCVQADVTLVCGEVPEELQSALPSGLKTVPFHEMNRERSLKPEEIYIPEADEILILMCTSGTTGTSKVVAFSAENLRNSFDNLKETHARAGMERVFLSLPLFHIAGFGCVFQVFLNGHTVCMGRGVKYLFMDMPALNPTNISLVPLVLESIIKVYKQTKLPEQRIRYFGSSLQRISVGGASLKPQTISYMRAQGIVIDALYGMTETAGDGLRCVLDDKHVGTIGYTSGNMQCCIKDGEIMLKSPSVMKGYYKDPEETARVIEDGWIHTGDMGYCDEDGYYYITGRKKNVIILSNGENVNPEEIEAKWIANECIIECLVYSDGKGICADVYTEDPDLAATFVKEYNENVPLYHQVYKVHYQQTPLEKTSTGKIKRKVNT